MLITKREFEAVIPKLLEEFEKKDCVMTPFEWGMALSVHAHKYREEMADLNDFSYRNFHNKGELKNV